jgi:hypothetical protein
MIRSYQLHIKGEGTDSAWVQESIRHFKNSYQLFFGEACGALSELKVTFEFLSPVVLWRNHDYSWVDVTRRRVANFHSPKALMLKNGHKVVAGETTGLWEFDPRYPKRITWIIADKWLNPMFRYDEMDKKHFVNPGFVPEASLTLTFLFTKGKIPEFSRSRVPFSAILNFSDHCDFDSLELMERQRALFKKYQIRVSKGVFLFHHSKRTFNVSLERHADELKFWEENGHELCYHSLTQSIRPDNAWQADFEAFENAGHRWPTWIDHAFQPYNLTKMAASGYETDDWAGRMQAAGVRHLWNYLDAGHSGRGVVNQLDNDQFSLRSYVRMAWEDRSLAALTGLLRTYILYFRGEAAKQSYSRLVNHLRSKLWKESIKGAWGMVRGLVFLFGQFFKLLMDAGKKEVLPPWQKYAATFFPVCLGKNRFWFFQTVEVHDFLSTFSEKNLQLLKASSGICLAHTYFSDDDGPKKGRMFLNKAGEWMPGIDETFERIGDAAVKGELWLATITEIAEYFDTFRFLRFDVDERGAITHFIEKSGLAIEVRYVE